MRKIFLLILLALSLICFSQSDAGMVIGNWYTAACDTAFMTNTGARSGDLDIKDIGSTTFVGQTYNEGSAHSICKVTFYLTKRGNDITDKNYFVRIDSITGTDMDGNNVSDSSTVQGNNSWDDTAVEFSFSPAATIPASTAYVITMTHDAAVDATDYAEAEYTNDGAINGAGARYNADGTRSGTVAKDFKLVLYE